MNKWTTRIKWIAPLLMIAVLFATTTVAYGGLRWSGIDPQLNVNGHEIAATVYIPTAEACGIEGNTIHLEISVPNGADWDGTWAESEEEFDCGGEELTIIRTLTNAHFARVNRMRVSTMVPSEANFHVKLKVEMDGRTVRRCHGSSNDLVECRSLNIDADDVTKTTSKHHRGR